MIQWKKLCPDERMVSKRESEVVNIKKDFEIDYRDEQIKDLKEALAGTKRQIGYFKPLKGKWEINYSSILTKLIQEAGRWCEYYASDLFITWHNIDKNLDDGTMKTEQFVFGFRNNGVDHKGWYELHKNDVGRYRAVWFLDVIVNDQQMERNKNGRERYQNLSSM